MLSNKEAKPNQLLENDKKSEQAGSFVSSGS